MQSLSEARYAQLQVVESKARQLVEYSQGGSHITFTPHGISHISAVEQNYDWLLTDSDLSTFNASELFCLLCATFFHDALMIPRAVGDEGTAREQHVQRVRNFLVQNKDLISLSVHEANAISEVILGHGVDDLNEVKERVVLGSELVGLRKLGAVLSLSDISHADASRAPEIVLRHLELNQESMFHWRRHLQISGITRKDDSIIMSALTFSDEGEKAVADYRQAIQHQLNIIRPYFDTILTPIRRVELIADRLESPLQQTLQFQTNTPAILKILIDGVYEREDVFVRELVQNSLDSCLLRRAKEQRRNIAYEPQVLLTFFRENGIIKSFRIDDNGIGMDLNDVQDTVLWIGNSISTNKNIVELLQQTVYKDLIATFGIGLLSCFKASDSIMIRTAKENETPIQFKLVGVSETVKPEKSIDQQIGTTMIVGLNDSKKEALNFSETVEYYFRQVKQVELKLLDLEWSEELQARTREDLFKIARSEAKSVKGKAYPQPDDLNSGLQIIGEDFSGCIWLPSAKSHELLVAEGMVDILNEGIYVTSELTSEWISDAVSFCDGYLNFSSKSITLPAARDRVIKNEKFKKKVADINEVVS